MNKHTRPSQRLAIVAACVALVSGGFAAAPVLAADSSKAVFAGVIKDVTGRNLVKPLCLFLWPEDASAPDGFRASNLCVDVAGSGKFSTTVAPGDYKIQVLADNVAEGSFVGGATVAGGTVFTIPPSGLKDVALAIQTLAQVTGTVSGAAKQALINAQCVVFWQRDPSADSGWQQSSTCGELTSKGAFTAYVPVGDVKIQVIADNIGSDVFLGGDNTLAGATIFTVPSTGISKLKYIVPTLPKVTGRVTMLDGSVPLFPDSVFLWAPDATVDLGWSLVPSFWDINPDGTFTAFMAPGVYKFEFDFGKPRQRVYFGGATPVTAMPITIDAQGAAGLLFKVGHKAAPAGELVARAAGRTKSAIVAWAASAGATAPETYVATATPGGATCTTTGTSCTITGLTDGQVYSVAVRGFNSTGSIASAVVSVKAGPAPQQIIPDATISAPGQTIGVTIANAPSGATVKVSGKPGVSDVSVKTDELGSARVNVIATKPGTVTLTMKTKSGASTSVIYVPGVDWTTTIKAGKSATFTVVGVPPASTVNFTFSDGTVVPVTANAKGTVEASRSWTTPTTVTATATFSGRLISTATVTVTK